MGFDKIKLKQIRNLILLIAVLVLGIQHSELVFTKIVLFIDIMTPFIIGGVIAFVLNIPMRTIENSLLKNWKGKSAIKFKRTVSIILSILFIISIIALVAWSVVPQLGKTVVDLGKNIPTFFDEIVKKLEVLSVDHPNIQEWVQNISKIDLDWNSLIKKTVDFLQSGMTDVLSSTVDVASSIAGGLLDAFLGFIFAVYILAIKERLQAQIKKVMKAYLPEELNIRTLYCCSLLHDTFSNFVTGQCLEAVILCTMFVVGMSIFRIPYSFMIGILIGLTSLIPVVGAFIGFFVGSFMIVVASPIKALVFVILFLALQQIEENLIYPRVVGNKIGLPPIWVFAAVILGGSLFGVAGMLFFIPLVSTIYSLLRDSVNRRLREKRKASKENKQKTPN